MDYAASPSRAQSLPQSSISERIALEALQHPPLRAAVAIWQQLRGTRRFPCRDALSPRKIAGLLPYMSLLKVLDGGADFQHRIVGDVVVRAFTVPIQNRKFSEIAEDAPILIERCIPLFRHVVQTGIPAAWTTQTGHDATYVAYQASENVVLPLGRTDDAVDHLVAFGANNTNLYD